MWPSTFDLRRQNEREIRGSEQRWTNSDIFLDIDSHRVDVTWHDTDQLLMTWQAAVDVTSMLTGVYLSVHSLHDMNTWLTWLFVMIIILQLVYPWHLLNARFFDNSQENNYYHNYISAVMLCWDNERICSWKIFPLWYVLISVRMSMFYFPSILLLDITSYLFTLLLIIFLFFYFHPFLSFIRLPLFAFVLMLVDLDSPYKKTCSASSV